MRAPRMPSSSRFAVLGSHGPRERPKSQRGPAWNFEGRYAELLQGPPSPDPECRKFSLDNEALKC